MSLIVEDGTGIVDANTYVSISDVNTYCFNLNYSDWIESTDDLKKTGCILRSMRYIESFHFIGDKSQTTNILEWPRINSIDRNGIEISGIPLRLKDAVCEGAYLEFLSSGSLQPMVSRLGLKREEYGDVKFEYFSGGKQKPSISIITGLLVGLVESSHTVIRS